MASTQHLRPFSVVGPTVWNCPMTYVIGNVPQTISDSN